MNTQLINIDDIRQYKEVSKNTDIDKKVKSAINEAQEFDLRPVLGDQFWIDILAKVDSGDLGSYADLINGSTYEYSNFKYQHDGLKAILCYYAYARIIPALEENATPFGMVQKTNEFSTPLPAKRTAEKVAQAISGAQVFQARTMDYIYRNKSLFPLFFGNITDVKTGSLRISSVGGKGKIGGSKRCENCGAYSCRCRTFRGDYPGQFT